MLNATIAQVDLWQIEREGEQLLIHLLETMFPNEKAGANSVPAGQIAPVQEVRL
ncbi:MAG: hypothetical protein Q7R90_03240 [bacterium]|nr:hypothetical protein [bacterium]